MDLRTRRRVHLDTTPSRIGRFLALAVVLHAPLTPIAGLLGLISLLGNRDTAGPELPPVTEIPLDIIEDEGSPEGKPGDTPAAAPPPAEPEPVATEPDPIAAKPKPPKKPEKKPELPDAGALDASPESDAGTEKDAAAPGDAGKTHKPGEGIGSPVAGIGDKKVVDPNANVQLLVHTDRVRQHPLGARIGPLLRNVYQWRDFFGPTQIDPIRDVDRMLVVGSQLRDSRDVVAILQFNVPGERLRGAVDLLVSRDPEGGWVDGGVPIAHAHADRGERAFVFPSPQILVVTPPSAEASAARLPKTFRLPRPKGDEIALAKLATPWRAFLGLPIVIPKSIKSAELRLTARDDGGIVIDVLAHDETEPLAKSDAAALTAALTAATQLDLGLLGSVMFGSSKKKFIEKGDFEADGTDIRGEIVLTRSQVETLLELAGGFLGGGARSPRLRPSASAPPPAVSTEEPPRSSP
ncbi:MAG: hypothetical protein EOO73_31620 [Myxococcales bacterium]|nr:MAG: hypothetical protein EOO73_31620 [Myxococcales bacterium]